LSFFDYNPIPESSPYYLNPFSFPHLAAIGTLLVLVILIVVFRKRLAGWKGEPILRLVMTIVAVFFEVSLHILQLATQGWYDFLRGVIPFDLCAITLWLSGAINASKRRWIYDLLYFWGWGAAASYLFANTGGANWNTYHFWQYFILHGYVLLTMAWFGAVHSYRVRLRSLGAAFVVLFPISLAVRLFDSAFAGEPYKFNFMYLVSPPDVHSPLDHFGHGWGYYFAFVALGVSVLVAVWLPWGIADGLRQLRGRGSCRIEPASDRDADERAF